MSNQKDVVCYIFLSIAFLLIIATVGLFPGQVNSLPTHYWFTAKTSFILNQGIFKFAYYDNAGLELGAPFLTGLPFHYFSALWALIFGLSTQTAYRITGILLLGLSYASTIWLLIKLGSNRYIAIVMAFVYLSFHIIYDSAQFIATMYGFILIPFYITVDYILFFTFLNRKHNTYQLFLFYGIFTLIKVFALFLDGYSFVMYSVASIAVFLAYSVTHVRLRLAIDGFLFCFAHLLAYFLYKSYLPEGTSFDVMPLDFFRAQGVDIVSFYIPPSNLLYASLLKIGCNWNGLAFYGDGSNVASNYLGYTLVVFFVLFLILRTPKNAIVKFLIISGSLALILSLGPSLKVNNARDVSEIKNRSIQFSDYLMPPEEATFQFPYESIYVNVPGIKNMRAVYRWLVLFKFILIMSAALFLTYLLNKKNWWFVFFLTALVIIELLPNYPALFKNYRIKYLQSSTFDGEIIIPMKANCREGDRVFFMSNENDFLANYISAKLNIHSYNIGGDKNLKLSMKTWPPEILNLQKYKNVNKNMFLALSNGKADKIILPYFNLRWHAYYWPPNEKQRLSLKAQQLFHFDQNDNRFAFTDSKWFGIVELAPSVRLESACNSERYECNLFACILSHSVAQGFSPASKWSR